MTNRVRFVADMDDNTSGKLDKLRDKFDSLVSSKGGGALLMGVGLAGGVGAMGALSTAAGKAAELLGDSINAASDLNEVVSKSGQIFGPVSADIEAWADTASESFGQSKRQALEAAATFATFGKGAGLAGQDLAGFSTQLSELASDLASFHNASPEEAIQAIGAALRGEAEPMRRFGALIDDAALRNEALRQGLIKTTKEALTPQQRVLAAQALILRQTGDAQGDFARTGDGLANSQRSLNAVMEDLSAEIGEVFLPMAAELANTLATDVVPAVRDLVQAAKDAKPAWDLLTAGVDVALNGPLARLDDNAAEIERWKETQLQALTDASTAWGDSADGATEALREMNRGLVGFARESTDTARTFEFSMDDIVTSMTTTRDQLEAIVNDAVSAVYDPLRDEARLTSLEFEIAAQKRIVADKTATAEEKANAKERLLSLEAERESVRGTMILHGELKGDLAELSADYTRHWARASGSARAEIDKYIQKIAEARRATEAPIVANFSATGQVGSGSNHRAHGGPVWPGTWTVGENGPETLVLGPGGGGYVYPNGSGGGGNNVTVNIALSSSARNGEELARELIRPLQRELQRQNLHL